MGATSNNDTNNNNNTPKKSYKKVIDEFYDKHDLQMKLKTVNEHLEDMKEIENSNHDKISKAVEMNWAYLSEVIDAIHSRMEKLNVMLQSFEKNRWFWMWWDPPYQEELEKIEELQKKFEERFSWYLKIISCSRVTKL